MNAVLKKKGFGERVIEIPRESGPALLTFHGLEGGVSIRSADADFSVRGVYFGYFAPRYDFTFESDVYVVQARRSYFGALVSIMVERNGAVVYSEGDPPYEVTHRMQFSLFVRNFAISMTIVAILWLLWQVGQVLFPDLFPRGVSTGPN